jgi:hypothetical protein
MERVWIGEQCHRDHQRKNSEFESLIKGSIYAPLYAIVRIWFVFFGHFSRFPLSYLCGPWQIAGRLVATRFAGFINRLGSKYRSDPVDLRMINRTCSCVAEIPPVSGWESESVECDILCFVHPLEGNFRDLIASNTESTGRNALETALDFDDASQR